MIGYENLSLFTAADELMEKAIHRTTYKNLYLFKKTLEETGQSVLAATVPVQLGERNAASQDSLVAEMAATVPEKLEERNAASQDSLDAKAKVHQSRWSSICTLS